jgi:prepilin-type N-terminal cleavage/methylation domain-containing protein
MRARSQQGFTLIEVVVAVAIMAFSLAALFRLFSVSLNASSTAGNLATETSLARSLLALLDGTGDIEIGDEGGTLEGGYRWQRRVVEWTDTTGRPLAGTGILPVEVTLKVWSERRGDVGVTLTTFRLMPTERQPGAKL